MKEQISQYPSTYYRVSAKAIIRNKNGEVLLVKEQGSGWSLPGGGIDHGETVVEALRRELYEELLITAPFEIKPVGVDFIFMNMRKAWLMWVVYEVSFDELPEFGVGADAEEAAFIDTSTLKSEEDRLSQLVYRWTVDRNHEVKPF